MYTTWLYVKKIQLIDSIKEVVAARSYLRSIKAPQVEIDDLTRKLRRLQRKHEKITYRLWKHARNKK